MARGIRFVVASVLLFGALTAVAQRGGPGTAPRVRMERPVVRGSLSVDVVQRLLRRRSPEVMRCYEAGLREQPSLTGDFTLRLVVGADGRVKDATARQRQGLEDGVFGCVTERAKRWTFPSTGAGLVIIDWKVTMRPPTGQG